ncbi:uncharacterized protein [Cherax quadricarinatus]|uniref:uncharacterized protein n=1 Tax=Cherax quadricarinatus TaxID=27406 RepID=UPI00387E65A7
MSINEKLFYGEPSSTRSKYVCILDDSDSEPEVDDPELLDSGDKYLPPDAEVSSDDEEEERPAKKQKLVKKKKGITIEEYPDEEDMKILLFKLHLSGLMLTSKMILCRHMNMKSLL